MEQQEPAVSVASCRGKDFEHHERTEFDGDRLDRWRCPDCGDTGTGEALLAKLLALLPVLEHLQEQMLDKEAVFLLPSDATPGHLGECFGRPVYRMQGIDRPLIALGPDALSVVIGKALAKRTDWGAP